MRVITTRWNAPSRAGAAHTGGASAAPAAWQCRRYALLQIFIGVQQRAFGALVVGDVVVAGDVATARQRLAAHLDHLAVAAGSFEHMRRAGAHMPDTPIDLVFDIALAQFAALGVVADQIGHRPAHIQHAIGIAEQLLITPVPGGQAHVRVDHADRGADVFQRGGQNLAIEAQLLAGFVQHRHHFAQFHARTAQQAGQHQARGGGADGGGEQAFGELHPGAVGHHGGLQFAFQQRGLVDESAMRVPFAHHTLGQRLQIGHAHMPRPVAGHRRALRVRVQKRRCTQPLVHAGTPARGDQHHRAHVDQQRPERAMRQRVPAAHAEQLLRLQPGDAERPVHQPVRL